MIEIWRRQMLEITKQIIGQTSLRQEYQAMLSLSFFLEQKKSNKTVYVSHLRLLLTFFYYYCD